MKNVNKFKFNLNGLKLSETCMLYSDFPKTMDFSNFIEMCDRGKLHSRFGTKEDPNVMAIYEYTWETTELAGRRMYVILNEFRGMRRFIGFSLEEEDVKNILFTYVMQNIRLFDEAA
jgi:uncharacterized protein YgiM (DUF1202 family)